MTTFGNRIKSVRQELKLSQEQFGQIFDAGKSYISAVENDKSKLSVDNLVKLLVDYKVNINYLLADIGTMFVEDDVNEELLKQVQAEVNAIWKKYGVPIKKS